MTYEQIQNVTVIPRCQTCNRHTVYIIKNKKTGDTKYFCKLCGEVRFLSYLNDSWEIIHLK